jgi:hypothetical protein
MQNQNARTPVIKNGLLIGTESNPHPLAQTVLAPIPKPL